jgi:hypothetical protein
MTEKSPDFMVTLEQGIRDVLQNKKASMKDRINAINAGTKLMLIKHKISDTGDEAGSFFNKGK